MHSGTVMKFQILNKTIKSVYFLSKKTVLCENLRRIRLCSFESLHFFLYFAYTLNRGKPWEHNYLAGLRQKNNYFFSKSTILHRVSLNSAKFNDGVLFIITLRKTLPLTSRKSKQPLKLQRPECKKRFLLKILRK